MSNTLIPGVRVPAGGLLLGDEIVTSSTGGTYEHVFAATGEVNATVALAGAEEVDRAVQTAKKAQREWLRIGPEARRDLLNKYADLVETQLDELTTLNVHDNGMPLLVSGLQPATLVRYLRYYAGYADKAHGESAPGTTTFDLNLIEREPYGVVGVILPWNGPMFQIGMSVAPALAAGNAVILKPSPLAPLTSLRVAELALEAGLPAGLFQVIPGSGSVAGDALVRNPGVGRIAFTGSVPTAKTILSAAAENMTPVGAELGGKAAAIVFADADLDQAAQIVGMNGPLGLSGQSCAASNRILVEDSAYDAFVEKLLGVVDSLPFGDPLNPSTFVGPVISENAADHILEAVEQARRTGGGELLRGGERAGGELANGWFVKPTIFGDFDNASILGQVEIFGPVAGVARFTTEAEAIAKANDTVYGLTNYVHTGEIGRGLRVAKQLESGTVWINQGADITPSGPYGGYKQSGLGRSGGLEGIHENMRIKNIRAGIPSV